MTDELAALPLMTEEPWNKHTPGDPMPCKCGDSVVEVKLRDGRRKTNPAAWWSWSKINNFPGYEITAWRFVERKGEDVIAADPYDALEWDEDGLAIVVLKKPSRPWWVGDDDLVRFYRSGEFVRADKSKLLWSEQYAFQIKRRPVLTPAVPQLFAVLSVATAYEASAIRSAARRANIEVPE